MRRWVWIAAITLIVIGVGSAWFWSLAAVAPDQKSEITLEVQRSPVTVTFPEEATARDATSGMVLPEGAMVATGEGGRAVIHFYHQAESRLDSNTKSMISSASFTDAGMNVRVDVQKGRIWSRVLRLFDLDASFAVKTPSVVATVRGTAFDVRANADGTSEVWVSESAVSVTPAGVAGAVITLPEVNTFRVATSTPVIAAGESARYAADGTPVWRKPISDEDRASAWFTENRAADEIFQRDAATRLRKELDGRSDVIGRAMEGFIRASEWAHLTVARGADEDRFAEIYTARHIASAVVLAESGKAGLAAQAFSRIENELKGRLASTDADRERARLHAALQRVAPMIQDAAPGSAAYPFKQRVEDLVLLLQKDHAPEALYARLCATNARLDEAERLMASGTLDEAKNALTAAHDGVGNALREAGDVLGGLEEPRKSALVGKLYALMVRDAVERTRLETLLARTKDGSIPVAATSTAPTVPVSPSGSTSTPATASLYTGISVYAQPNPIDPGSASKLTVLATKVSGGTEDVSARASYRVVSGPGTLAKNVVTATASDGIVIEATFTDQNKTMKGRVTLNVNGVQAVLQELRVASNALTIAPGAATTLYATAVYSNGFQKDVTGSVTWTTPDPSLGTLAGNIFTAGRQAVGSVEVTATLIDAGVTKTGAASIVIRAAAAIRAAPNN